MRERIIAEHIAPGLKLLPDYMDTMSARAMLAAIGLQESRFEHRKQIGGPARGWWQFERAGIYGVLTHSATKDIIADVCARLAIPPVEIFCHELVAYHDALAACFARLLLWSLPYRLPAEEETDEAWRQYIEAWRPGKPHRATWNKFYDDAWKLARI